MVTFTIIVAAEPTEFEGAAADAYAERLSTMMQLERLGVAPERLKMEVGRATKSTSTSRVSATVDFDNRNAAAEVRPPASTAVLTQYLHKVAGAASLCS